MAELFSFQISPLKNSIKEIELQANFSDEVIMSRANSLEQADSSDDSVPEEGKTSVLIELRDLREEIMSLRGTNAPSPSLKRERNHEAQSTI